MTYDATLFKLLTWWIIIILYGDMNINNIYRNDYSKRMDD